MLPQKPKRRLEKGSDQVLAAANVTGAPQSRLFFFGNTYSLHFLVDTGAALSLLTLNSETSSLSH